MKLLSYLFNNEPDGKKTFECTTPEPENPQSFGIQFSKDGCGMVKAVVQKYNGGVQDLHTFFPKNPGDILIQLKNLGIYPNPEHVEYLIAESNRARDWPGNDYKQDSFPWRKEEPIPRHWIPGSWRHSC